jgi:trehalose 6-phosphate synthase
MEKPNYPAKLKGVTPSSLEAVGGTRSPRTPRMRRSLSIGTVKRRIIVVSNRLPVTINKKDGKYTFQESSGGLVSGKQSSNLLFEGLEGVKKKLPFVWVGWPGVEIPLADQEHVTETLRDDYHCVPVFLPQTLADQHYNGT